MYADRYNSRGINPGSLSLSVGIVGGLIAAGMMTSTVISDVIRERPPLETYEVPREVPPPDEVKPEPEVEARAPVPLTPEPLVPAPAEPDRAPIAQPDPGPIDMGGSGGGTAEGTGAAPVDPPKPPPPVLTRADVDPRYARDFQPIYPAAEQRAGSEGVVSLRVLIGVDGRVRQVERLASPSDAFWRVTEQRALSKWRFTPATRDGIPYESWKTMTVRFRIDA